MKIKKIQLKNGYKRFHDLTIDLGEDPKRIIALVGQNGCGKSSVFDGILFHHNMHSNIGNKSPKDYKYHSMKQFQDFDYQNIVIEFKDGNYQDIRNIKYGKENTIFSFRSPYRYNSNVKIEELRSISDIILNDYGATTSSDIDDKMEQNYRRLNIAFNKYIKKNHETATYDSTKNKIIGDLNFSLKQCLDLEISSIGDVEAGEGTLFFKKSDQSTEFEFNVLSSGEKEVVDILLDLYLRKDEYNDTIFIIDEPELHINTAIQRKLLIEVNKLIGENCQIWIATHSIGFLRALQDELKNDSQLIYFPRDINWASSVQTLKPINRTIAMWKDVFETALDDLVGLLSPKRIIYCEGKYNPGHHGQENGFDAKVLNNIFGDKYQDTLFVSSGGNTEPDQRSAIAIKILKKPLPQLEIWVFKDRDIGSGKQVNECDRIVYLKNNPDCFRIMKRFELENYLFDKEVLKKYCQDNSLSFDENSYDKFVTNIYDQNLKDEIGKIKNFCGVVTNINEETFKIHLSKYLTGEMEVYKELEDNIFNRS